MQNQPGQGNNPSLPIDAEATKKAKRENVSDTDVNSEEKSEEEKEKESQSEDFQKFNVDKTKDLEETKKKDQSDE